MCRKGVFPVGNGKTELASASMVVIYCIKLYRTGAKRYNGILMSLLLLVAETKKKTWKTPTPCFKSKYILEKIFRTKIEKCSKTGQGKKSLIFTFACFLTTITKV